VDAGVLTRSEIAEQAVRAALAATTVPHRYTQTRPHDRQIRHYAGRDHRVYLTDDEIETALNTVMNEGVAA
jgi:hypothetical protein